MNRLRIEMAAIFGISLMLILVAEFSFRPKEPAYKIYIDQKAEKYIIKDGDRTVWEGHVNDHSQIDSLILSDNL